MDPITAIAKMKAEETEASPAPIAPPRGKQKLRRKSSISTLSDDYVASFFSGPDTTNEEALKSRKVQDASSDGSKIKASYVSQQLKTRLNEYTFTSDITVCAGTFNVNGRKPVDTAADGSSVSVSLDDWLVQNLVDEPDVYAIGFQELDLSKENFLLNNSSYEDMWTPVRIRSGELHTSTLASCVRSCQVPLCTTAHPLIKVAHNMYQHAPLENIIR
eukprot:m.733280 g.733280  ORF g.733280 m.733280 type:complete len:217 (-) comp23070_c0_seq12:138-788(-)